MTVNHIHPAERDKKLLEDLARSCLQQLRAMRAESRGTENALPPGTTAR